MLSISRISVNLYSNFLISLLLILLMLKNKPNINSYNTNEIKITNNFEYFTFTSIYHLKNLQVKIR